MKKISIILQLLLVAFVFSCQETPIEKKDVVSDQKEPQVISRFYYNDKYFDVPPGSSLKDALKKYNVGGKETFQTSTDESTLYVFDDQDRLKSFLQKNYPDVDIRVIESPTDRQRQDFSYKSAAKNENARVTPRQSVWDDFYFQFYFASGGLGDSQGIMQTGYIDLLNLYGSPPVGEVPSQIYAETPANGSMTFYISRPNYGSATYQLGPGSNTVKNNIIGAGLQGTILSWSLSRSASPNLLAIAENEVKTINKNTVISASLITGITQATDLASTRSTIYFVQQGILYQANPYDGFKTPLGNRAWDGTEALAASDGFVYAVDDNLLWKINANTGEFTQFGNGTWEGTEAMAASGGFVYAVDDNALWKVNTSTGAISTLGNGTWGGTATMTAAGSYVYAVADNALWRVHTGTGAITTFGAGTWNGTSAMTNDGTNLYIIESGTLYRVNMATAAIDRMGFSPWSVALTSIMP